MRQGNTGTRIMKSIFARIMSIHPTYSFLNNVVEMYPVRSILDVGCGQGGPFEVVNWEGKYYVVGIDLFGPALKDAKKVHNDVILADMAHLPIREKCVDAVLSVGAIEHLSYADGIRLISKMEKIARMLVAVTTTTTYRVVDKPYQGGLEEHKSSYSPELFKRLGYSVKGLAHRFDILTRLYYKPLPFKIILFLFELIDGLIASHSVNSSYFIASHKNVQEEPTLHSISMSS